MLRILFGMPALVALMASSVVADPLAAEAATDTNVAARVARSDIHVEQPNILPSQAMPLGNGRLGVALWAAQGLTAQLNRSDTLPRRLSPGWLVVPGLAQMVADRGFRARLHLHDGQWRATGGGLTARAYVDQEYDRFVVEVGGADPGVEQTAQLQLWPPRTPQTIVADDVALLVEQ